ncbi:hypothetical protein [Tahibacter amnicola]|uniref:FG-GAP repeat protein n=1 Tax=Tahibacter amnicola TaxID=2976241 RepID=A0ABY6BIN8_9GAMM|nr:hypothetical protein [Tahibacter amnicola]UXI69705.1 hypothetical protein N4264_08755 [Tahibacter amnicola]
MNKYAKWMVAGMAVLGAAAPDAVLADAQRLGPPAGGTAYPAFAQNIALDDLTGTVAASSHLEQNAGTSNRGAVELFRRADSGWNHVGTLKDPTADIFGWRLAAGDGWIAVGAAVSGTHVIDLFQNTGAGWVYRQRLVPSIPGVPAVHLGKITLDGGNLLVGSSYFPGNMPGKTQVEAYRLVGETWQSEGVLETPYARWYLGRAMVLSGDSAVVTVEFPTLDQAPKFASFVRNQGQWQHVSSALAPAIDYPYVNHALAICGGNLFVSVRSVNVDGGNGLVQRYTGSASAWTPSGNPLTSGDHYFGWGLGCSAGALGITAPGAQKAYRLAPGHGAELETLQTPEYTGRAFDDNQVVVHANDVIINDMWGLVPAVGYVGAAFAFLDDRLFRHGFD